MFSSLFHGVLLGLGAAVPLGPINLITINAALSNAKSALLICLGAMLANIMYLGIALLGFYMFLLSPLIEALIAIFGSAFLFYLTILIYRGRNRSIKEHKEKTQPLLQSFLKGYLFTLSNPYIIAFWLSIASLISSSDSSGLWLLLGVIMVILCWITFLPILIFRMKCLISQKVSFIFSVSSSLIMPWFATALLINLAQKHL
ncbi:MAG: LysE family translocator [Wolinella sp.]